MKKAFLLLCALLLVLGSALPLAGYRLARAVLGRRAAISPAPASSTSAVSEAAPAAFEGDADVFLIEDLHRRGAAGAEAGLSHRGRSG